MITITLTADTFEELQRQAVLALGLKPPLRPFSPEPVPAPPEVKLTAAERKKQEARDKLRGKPVVEPQPEPDEVIVSVPGLDPEPEPEPEPEYVEVPVPAGNATAEAVALEKLKAETMILIQDMFAAGKVKHIRAVLDKHGGGAKSFPEIEAKEFPVINAALREAA